MTKEEDTSNSKKKNNTFKYILLFIILLVIGIAIGVYGANKYLVNKDDGEDTPQNEELDYKDISNIASYQEQIDKLHSVVKDNSLFYNSQGVNVISMDNGTKLTLIYNYLIANGTYTNEELMANESGYCEDIFVKDTQPDDQGVPTLVCTTVKISASVVSQTGKTLFNDDNLNTTASFSPSSGKNCVVKDDNYICGNVSVASATGVLEPKFEIKKVLLKDNGNIEIYDKGYLIDHRSGINVDTQYTNYYLHSSDSTSYYYELKSADNLTFKHIFKTDDSVNYYYIGSELVKE